jgi:hypothetical protein
MRVEQTDKPPVVDLRTPDGVRKQREANEVTAVLLSDGNGTWMDIVPGSFHFWVTGDTSKGERAVPYVQFTLQVSGEQVECFPTSCSAFKYRAKAK